ncbi:glycosyltransferase [Salinibacter ruber]|uniref:glycosyltransferase n=1 Tax=Salinibacter ruber TaxID=146919 RepID=UPI002167610D|nr:glycosyltransferase [Salinibacter ruber]MCS4149394.1 glycosyltransferase involved in cell wall biosynthesis [Salinibacter ruber]
MKVLYIVSRLRNDGPSTQLAYIVKHLDSTWEPIILTLSPEDGATLRPKFEQEGIQVWSFGFSRYLGLIKAPMRLRKFCRDVDPDVIHSQGIRPDILSAFFLGHYPRISTLRNYAYEDYPGKFGRLKGYPAAALHLAVAKRVDVPVACSHGVRRKVSQHGIKPDVIQNGVDTDVYHPPQSTDEKRHLRRSLGLPENQTLYISVGFLIPRKDPKLVIRGFQESKASEEGVLVILGDGPLLEQCRQQATTGEGDVRLPGYVEDVSSYLQAADFFLSASHSEGLPNTVMEALSSGLPVILSDIPAHREILSESSQPGEFFDPGDLSGMSKAIDNIRGQNRTELEQKARKLTEDKFTARRVSRDYQSLYRDTIEMKSRSS